jgi:hypothetical protein
MAKHLFDVSSRVSGLCAVSPLPRLPLSHCSIELLYYRTSVPSNERLVREANVNATVAERGGRARSIRNHGSRDARHRRSRPNPWTSATSMQVKVSAKSAVPGARRPSHLRLVADHGRIVDPDFQPGRPVWVNGVPVRANRGEGAVRHTNGQRGAARARAGRTPARLTRRGRLVLTSGIVLLIAVASMVLASAAQAAVHP